MWKRNTAAVLFTILVIFAAAGFFYNTTSPWQLVVYTPKNGQILHRFPLEKEAAFSLHYIHSVTQREVSGTFTVTVDGKIKPLTTTFDAYGPG
ncbi:MAG: hypothetical protein SCK29_11760, partial [Bacillota bacterium]|nr:hypothetical protein [Bacillota bacterium]